MLATFLEFLLGGRDIGKILLGVVVACLELLFCRVGCAVRVVLSTSLASAAAKELVSGLFGTHFDVGWVVFRSVLALDLRTSISLRNFVGA